MTDKEKLALIKKIATNAQESYYESADALCFVIDAILDIADFGEDEE